MRAVRVSLLACAFAIAALPDDIVLPDGKAKTLIENTCSECHGLDAVVSNSMSAEKWRSTVNSMVKKGATLTPAEIDTVVEYLSVYFPQQKVNVNTAGPQELQDGLQLTAPEVKAIIQYRKANGAFRDLAGLQKVPGLDAKRIDARKDAITF